MLKILDLFAGAGGLSLGFEKTSHFEVAAIVENNKNAAKTYLRNHPGLKNYEDILTVDFQQIKKECGIDAAFVQKFIIEDDIDRLINEINLKWNEQINK